MGWTQLKIIKEDCDPNVDNTSDLPNNCYLVTYNKDGAVTHDLVAAAKQSEIFDNYYDKYKKDFVFMRQSEGRANPKLWGNPSPKERKKKS
tara:strand:- start:586 stop:858 length:273 start_codon:yes stop_codon:yes gene_type:complete